MATRKSTGGKKKIEMVKIEKESSRVVTFSKRRAGLFKSASELSILCGAEIAIVAFSPAGRAHTFGHPSVNSVIERFVENNGKNLAFREENARKLYEAACRYQAHLEAKVKCAEDVEEMKQLWNPPIEEMDMKELQELKKKLEGLKEYVKKKKDALGHGGIVIGHEKIEPSFGHDGGIVGEKIEPSINLELTLGPPGSVVFGKPEGSNARK